VTTRPELTPHLGMLRRYLFVLGAPPERLDDLVQEVVVVVLQRAIEDRGHGPVGAFLRGVARNLVLRERRSAAGRREVELAVEVWHEHCGADDREARLASPRDPARLATLRAAVGERIPSARTVSGARAFPRAAPRPRAALRQRRRSRTLRESLP
jgi:DNA-directed RNA polymerase specialized sigma24 family protein